MRQVGKVGWSTTEGEKRARRTAHESSGQKRPMVGKGGPVQSGPGRRPEEADCRRGPGVGWTWVRRLAPGRAGASGRRPEEAEGRLGDPGSWLDVTVLRQAGAGGRGAQLLKSWVLGDVTVNVGRGAGRRSGGGEAGARLSARGTR